MVLYHIMLYRCKPVFYYLMANLPDVVSVRFTELELDFHTRSNFLVKTEGIRKGWWYGWKPSSSSNFSIRAFRAYPLIEVRQAVPCRAIRGSSISVSSRRRWHCGRNPSFDMVQFFNQKKWKPPLWNKYSFKGFVKKHPKNEHVLHRPDFHYFLLIICDN